MRPKLREESLQRDEVTGRIPITHTILHEICTTQEHRNGDLRGVSLRNSKQKFISRDVK